MRLIDMELLLAEIEVIQRTGKSTFKEIVSCIKDQPVIDAVPVVRCKDCASNPSRSNQKGFCPRAGICMVCSDGYCDFGKKVTE